ATAVINKYKRRGYTAHTGLLGTDVLRLLGEWASLHAVGDARCQVSSVCRRGVIPDAGDRWLRNIAANLWEHDFSDRGKVSIVKSVGIQCGWWSQVTYGPTVAHVVLHKRATTLFRKRCTSCGVFGNSRSEIWKVVHEEQEVQRLVSGSDWDRKLAEWLNDKLLSKFLGPYHSSVRPNSTQVAHLFASIKAMYTYFRHPPKVFVTLEYYKDVDHCTVICQFLLKNRSNAQGANRLLLGFENQTPPQFITPYPEAPSDDLVQYNIAFNRGSSDWFFPIPVGDADLIAAPWTLGSGRKSISEVVDPLFKSMEKSIDDAIALKPDLFADGKGPRTYFVSYLKCLLRDFIVVFNLDMIELNCYWTTRRNASWFVVEVHVPDDWPCATGTAIRFQLNDKYLATLALGCFAVNFVRNNNALVT
ncbi:hypothetical protein AAF712_016544, partial [Marasmius tenuissimus]